MSDALLETETARQRLQESLQRLNTATFRVQEAMEDYRSGAIPSPVRGYALKQALITETEARRLYMELATTLHKMIVGNIPSEQVNNSVLK